MSRNNLSNWRRIFVQLQLTHGCVYTSRNRGRAKYKYNWDDKSSTLTLTPRKDSSIRKFHIKDESTLIQLTPEEEPMKGDQDKYSLKKSDGIKSREIHIH